MCDNLEKVYKDKMILARLKYLLENEAYHTDRGNFVLDVTQIQTELEFIEWMFDNEKKFTAN